MLGERIPARVEGFLLERVDDDVLLYHPNLAKTIRLNEPASMVWELCDGQRSARAITELLQAAYPEDQQQVEEDVASLLQHLTDEGALVLS